MTANYRNEIIIIISTYCAVNLHMQVLFYVGINFRPYILYCCFVCFCCYMQGYLAFFLIKICATLYLFKIKKILISILLPVVFYGLFLVNDDEYGFRVFIRTCFVAFYLKIVYCHYIPTFLYFFSL